MVASVKLLHLLEAFSTPWFLLSAPNNHHLVFFLLEIFNNIIQYQFDGNSNLVYTIIRKRHVFHAMANLPTDMNGIAKCLNGRKGGKYSLPPFRQYKGSATTPTSSLKEDNTIAHSFQEDEINAGVVDGIVTEIAEDDIERVNKGHEKRVEEHIPSNLLTESDTRRNMEEAGSIPNHIKTSLLETPGINQMTESAPMHDDGDYMEKTINNKTATLTLNSSPSHESEELSTQDNDGHDSPSKSELKSFTVSQKNSIRMVSTVASQQAIEVWTPTPEWIVSWRSKLPLQTIMRLLQVLVPQVEKICIDKGLTDESEILKFLQHGTLVGLLPVPHPILIRKYQANAGTTAWFRTYIWGVIYLRNMDPAIWYDTDIKLFEIQRV